MTKKPLNLRLVGRDDAPSPEHGRPEELALAERTRIELERGESTLAASLRAAWSPDALDAIDHEALIARGLGEVEAPATAAEARASKALAASLEATGAEQAAPFVESLRHAMRPRSIDPSRNSALVEAALDGALSAPTESERVLAERLRRSLEGEGIEDEFVAALRAAHAPKALAASTHAPMVHAAIARASRISRQRAFVWVAAAAMAAGAAFAALRTLVPTGASPAVEAAGARANAASEVRSSLAMARSTRDLFDPAERFSRQGGESGRIDRIVASRASDLRENRFQMWGVR